MDFLTPEQRSERMRRVRGKNTTPERAVRRLVTELGYRYRLQYNTLPGRPDLAFPGRKRVIWVHGCYWHRHLGCRLATTPKTNQGFWRDKFKANQIRDRRNADLVQGLGWEVLVVWQCEIVDLRSLRGRIGSFLERPAAHEQSRSSLALG